MSECRKARKRPIPFDCHLGAGHEGKCSPYTLPPTARYEDRASMPALDVLFVAYDETTGSTRQITRQEAVDNLMALAAKLGRGTACAGVLERYAAEIARGGTAGFSTTSAAGQEQAARKAA